MKKSLKNIQKIFLSCFDKKQPFNYRINNILKCLSFIIPSLMFIFSFSIVVYYILVASKGEFHSDCTDTILWANASFESGHLIDKSFSYSAFLPFGINIIMMPFINIFGLSLTTHYIGMMIFLILLTAFLFMMFKEMNFNIRFNFLIVSLFLSMTLCTEKMREIFWGHTIYYSLGILFLTIGLYLYFHIINLNNNKNSKIFTSNKHYFISFSFLSAFILLTSTNGVYGLSIFVAPFLGAIVLERILNNNTKFLTKEFIHFLIELLILVIMVYLGMKLNKILTNNMVAGYQEAYSVYSNMDKWVSNLLSLPIAWFKILGVRNLGGSSLFSVDSIINLIYIINALLVAIIPIVATCYYKKYDDNKYGYMIRIWIWIHWIVTFIILFGYICGLLSSADWRIIPIVGTSIILSFIFMYWCIYNKNELKRIMIVIILPILCVTSFLNLKNVYNMPRNNYINNVLFQLSKYIEEQKLTYGYATFWNANAITVISGSNIKVRNIDITDYGIIPRSYQSSTRWYENQKNQDNYFLLLTESEYKILEQKLGYYIDNADKILTTSINNSNYYIIVYNYNVINYIQN